MIHQLRKSVHTRNIRVKPNILLLFTDQHQADCLSLLGHPDVQTPNLDGLARSGMLFRRAYCQDGICVPSRMSIMTGLYPRHLGILDNSDRTSIADAVESLASVLQRGGYITAAFGKRHLFAGGDAGWDVARSHLKNESPGNSYWEWIEQQGLLDLFQRDWDAEFGKKYPFAEMATRVSGLPEGTTMEAFTAKHTIDFIRAKKRADKPFFCWSSFYRPHQPYTPLPRYLEMYDYSRWGDGTNNSSTISRPAGFDQAAKTLPPAFQSLREGSNRVWRLDKALEDESLFRFYIASYYALLTEIDDHVGAILQALEEEGLRENTIIVYTTDHGDFVGRHGMVEKCATGHNVYEDTLRVPLFISQPGRIPQGESTDLVELVDLFPTLVELAEVDHTPAQGLDGRSLAPTLLRGEPVGRSYVVSENWSQAAVITEQHKLGIWLDPLGGPEGRDYRSFGNMLFDRDSDPFELTNCFREPEYAHIVTGLEARYQDFIERVPATGKNDIMKGNRRQ